MTEPELLPIAEEPIEALPPARRYFLGHPLLSTACALFLGAGGTLLYLVLTLPQVASLARQRPGVTSLMEQREREARAEGREPQSSQIWVPLKNVSPLLIQAVLTGEDANFYGHHGFDLYEIRESVEKNWERGRLARGASTITQQLAKNLFLSTEKSLTRKLKEAILTYRLERDLTKSRILEIYLNVIEWGDGIYGVEAAARAYFGKPAASVDLGEAALLAALIPNPRRFSQERATKALKTRQERILNWMWKAGKISEEEYLRAKERSL